MAMDLEQYKELNHQFYEKIGIINWYKDLEAIGLTPKNVFCTFDENDIEMLLNFCQKNPKFHIVTNLSDYKTVNRFVRGDYIYSLAYGDCDPRLEKITPPEIIDHMVCEIELFIQSVKSHRGL